MTLFTKAESAVAAYKKRNKAREKTLLKATMNLVGYFMALGDDQLTANGKVQQLSAESAALVYLYIMGNTQPLIDSINASALTFMDTAAKAQVTGDLVPPV